MIIEGKRIQNVQRHLAAIQEGRNIVVGISFQDTTQANLERAGFTQLTDNTAVLPNRASGPISRFNADGGFIIHRDQDKIEDSREVWREWNDWHGNPHSGFVTIHFMRYPRTPIPPPLVEFKIVSTTEGNRLIITPSICFNNQNRNLIRHRINLVLEAFGRCEIFSENLNQIIEAPIVRVNWRVLPPGARPWNQILPTLNPIIQQTSKGQHQVIRQRLETINGFQPEFVAVGIAGFTGYLVFGFPTKGLFILESIFFGNATYVLNENWQALAQRTKAELIQGQLVSERVVHKDNWNHRINQLLG